MRNLLFSIVVVALWSCLTLAQDTGQAMAKTKKAATPVAPRSDAEVQTCINDKFKTSTSVKNGNAAVSNGTATLTGEAASGGAKGGATRSAKACGAKTVVNNIMVPPKPKTPAEKKP